jgi:hypothetical protein
MSTCPRCKGHLTDAHKCPRRPAVVAAEMTVGGLAGGFAGLVLLAIFDPREQITDVEVILVVAAGALIVGGITTALRRR